MGILKLLGKGCNFISESGIPEAVGFIGGMLHVVAMIEAYTADYKRDKVEFKDNYYSTEVELKTNPGEVLAKLVPCKDFSVREAVKLYKDLDYKARDIFWIETAAIGCGLFYAGFNLFRMYRLCNWGCKLLEDKNRLQKNKFIAEQKLEKISDGLGSVIRFYESDKSHIESEGDLYNYRNCCGVRRDINIALEALSA